MLKQTLKQKPKYKRLDLKQLLGKGMQPLQMEEPMQTIGEAEEEIRQAEGEVQEEAQLLEEEIKQVDKEPRHAEEEVRQVAG
jgi:hypothetical protein